MVDINIHAVVTGMQGEGAARNNVVWKTDQVGFMFYVYGDGLDEVVAYTKTTDGGLTWTSVIEIDRIFNDLAAGIAIWAEMWTEGFDSSTIVHLAWLAFADEVVYTYRIDLSNDTFTSRVIAYAFGEPSLADLDLCKARNGFLYMTLSNDVDHERTLRSTNNGTAWSEIADVRVASPASNDRIRLFPGNERNIADMWACYYDDSEVTGSDVLLRRYDESADSWATIGTFPNVVALTGPAINGATRPSDRHVIFALCNPPVSTSIEIYDVNGSSITKLTNVVSSVFIQSLDVFIDPTTNDIYVAYIRGDDVGDTNARVYYKRSTDNGTTWGAETDFSVAQGSFLRQVWAGHTIVQGNGGRFQPVWFDNTGSPDNLLTNFDNSVQILPGGPFGGAGGQGAIDVLASGRGHRFVSLWRIVRTDGALFLFTDHDSSLFFNGELYVPTGGFSASARESKAGLKHSNLEIIGMVTSDDILHDDLRAGFYRDAEVTEFVVDWRFPWVGAIITNKYFVSETKFNGESWEANLNGFGHFLRQEVGDVYSRTCRHDLGDDGCQVLLAPLTASGSVTSIVTARVVFESDVFDPTEDFFGLGKLTWTSGANAGVPSEVREYQIANGTFELELKTPFDIAVNDAFTVEPGCDKLKSTCINKFANIQFFGGFPYIPGTDKMLETPDGRG